MVSQGGLSVAATREVIRAIDDPPDSVDELLGVAAAASAGPVDPRPDHTRVHELLTQWGWNDAAGDCSGHDHLAAALDALDDAGFRLPVGALDLYAEHVRAIAEAELAHVPLTSAADAVRYVVLGTVPVEPVLLALRRLAQHQACAEQFGDATAPPSPGAA